MDDSGRGDLTKRTENHKRKGVSKEEFENSTKAHQETSNEVVRADGGNAIYTGAPPAHELARKRTETEQEAKECQRRGICERIPKLAFDSILRVEIYLLKQLWTNGDGICGADLVDGFVRGDISVEMVG